MGDTIMVRSLAPLPRLEDVTLLRKGSREFVTGQGPFPALIPSWLGLMLFGYAALFAIAALVITVIAYQPELFLKHPLSPDNDWMRQLGPILFLPALLDLGIAFYFRRRGSGEKRFAAEAGLLPGEIISSRLRAAKGGNSLQVECRFTTPDGKVITGSKNAGKPGRSLKTPPAPGTPILILYGTDRLWQVL
ncbi:MAG TPA: hypothetical protein VHQ39_04445 [Dongiaceae bacterium]|nr:hypothetical protein [Dongiaceae bacterium]